MGCSILLNPRQKRRGLCCCTKAHPVGGFQAKTALLPLGFFMPKKRRDDFVNREKLIL